MKAGVLCPYCMGPAELVGGAVVFPHREEFRDRKYWYCGPCGAYVGVHRTSLRHKPLGRLANAELRLWRQRAHAVIDPLWLGGVHKRTEVYERLAHSMGMTREECHIGKFDVAQCKQAISTIRKLRRRKR